MVYSLDLKKKLKKFEKVLAFFEKVSYNITRSVLESKRTRNRMCA